MFWPSRGCSYGNSSTRKENCLDTGLKSGILDYHVSADVECHADITLLDSVRSYQAHRLSHNIQHPRNRKFLWGVGGNLSLPLRILGPPHKRNYNFVRVSKFQFHNFNSINFPSFLGKKKTRNIAMNIIIDASL